MEVFNMLKNEIYYIFGIVGGFLSYEIGGFDMTLNTLLCFMVIDVILGLINSFVFKNSDKTDNGKVSSSVLFKGLSKKVLILLYVIIANKLDQFMGVNYVRDGVCIAFIVEELTSILEIGGLMGVPLPDIIKNSIELLKGKEKGN